MARHRMTVLAPAPGRLPKRLLMLGNLRWTDP